VPDLVAAVRDKAMPPGAAVCPTRRHGRESSIFQEPSTTLDFILYIASAVLLVTCDGYMAQLVEGHQSYKHTARFQLMKSNCFVFFNHITVHSSI
jgi:hypothetical protein